MSAKDTGVTPANYDPTVNAYTGLIETIGKLVVENRGINSKFEEFFKGTIDYGKDTEVVLYNEATGANYSRNTVPSRKDPAKVALIITDETDKTYNVTVDRRQIKKSASGANDVENVVTSIIETLYRGADKDENTRVFGDLGGLTAGAATTAGTTKIVSGASLAEITSEATARAWVEEINLKASAMYAGASSVNPYAGEVESNEIVLFIPYDKMSKIRSKLLTKNNEDYQKLNVDKIIEYDPNASYASAMSASAILADFRFLQFRRTDNDTYEVDHIAGTSNDEAYLHTFKQYGYCPLFNAVKITEE